MEENKKQEIANLLGEEIEVELADGKRYKLQPFGITDLIYFEEKFGSVDVLFSGKKPFTVIVNILYCMLKKSIPELEFKDLDRLVTIEYINKHPELIQIITRQLTGSERREEPPKN